MLRKKELIRRKNRRMNSMTCIRSSIFLIWYPMRELTSRDLSSLDSGERSLTNEIISKLRVNELMKSFLT
jgi:hypothetical protein